MDYLHAYAAYIEIIEPSATFETTECARNTFFTRYYEAQVEIENFKGNRRVVPFLIGCGAFLVVLALVLILIRVVLMRKKPEIEGEGQLMD